MKIVCTNLFILCVCGVYCGADNRDTSAFLWFSADSESNVACEKAVVSTATKKQHLKYEIWKVVVKDRRGSWVTINWGLGQSKWKIPNKWWKRLGQKSQWFIKHFIHTFRAHSCLCECGLDTLTIILCIYSFYSFFFRSLALSLPPSVAASFNFAKGRYFQLWIFNCENPIHISLFLLCWYGQQAIQWVV